MVSSRNNACLTRHDVPVSLLGQLISGIFASPAPPPIRPVLPGMLQTHTPDTTSNPPQLPYQSPCPKNTIWWLWLSQVSSCGALLCNSSTE